MATASRITRAVAYVTSLTSTPTASISLCVAVLVVIGAWRHHDVQLHLNPLRQEIWVEWLTWAILCMFQKIVCPSAGASSTHDEIPRRRSIWDILSVPWVVAFACCGSQLLSSHKLSASILPLTTIAATLLLRILPTIAYVAVAADDGPIDYAEKEEETCSSRDPKETAPRIPVLLGLNGLCCILLAEKGLYDGTSNRLVALANLAFLLARCCSIVGISRMSYASQRKHETLGEHDTMFCIDKLTFPMLTVLTIILIAVRPSLEMSTTAVLLHATAQAAWWYATISLTRLQFTHTTANLDTISQSVQIAFTGLDVQSVAFSIVTAGIAALQSVIVTRPNANVQKAIWASSILFVLLVWLHEDPRLTSQFSPMHSTPLVNGHPIEHLVAQSWNHFQVMQQRQSQTLEGAIKEYVHRYGRRPPLGFDQWFNLAKENEFPLVDEFDTFMQSLEPFHGVHPAVIQQRITNALQTLDEGRVGAITFNSGNTTMSEGITGLAEILGMMNDTYLSIIPYNMTILINEWDESMVSVYSDEVNKAVIDAKNSSITNADLGLAPVHPLSFIETGKQSGWSATAHACPIDSATRQNKCPEHKLNTLLPWVTNTTAALDVCSNCDLTQTHGLLVSPGNMKVAHELVPIWSASKPSHFHDILYPSAYYVGARNDYREELDNDWASKDNKFYWTGTATGGWATNKTWPLMQRQRLVLKTNSTNLEAVQFLEEVEMGSGKFQPRYSSMAEVSELFSTRITGVVQCEDEACDGEKEAFGITSETKGDPQDAAYAHKFVFDVDGNGFSGRYYRLLSSKSCVVKSTILKEWHDDRLIPWVHYVPLSVGYQELPELARFLAGTEKGLKIAEWIASESRTWTSKALRDQDLRIAWVRMLLEWGRVMRPDLTM